MFKLDMHDTVTKYRAQHTRSGQTVLEVVGSAQAVCELVGQFTFDCLAQTGQVPEQSIPHAFRTALIRFEYTGLHGKDADRPWHVLEVSPE